MPWETWIAAHFAALWGRWPLFDMMLQSAIRHNMLGGFWFAAVLFILWAKTDERDFVARRGRIFTIMAASLLAVALGWLLEHFIFRLPPNRTADLMPRIPVYWDENPNTNCFPSMSTLLYTSVACGVYSLRRSVGVLLCLAVVFLVALPRMYRGGHYLNDVLVGMLVGCTAYAVARRLERPIAPAASRLLRASGGIAWAVNFAMFAWILQVAVEFREVSWVQYSLQALRSYAQAHSPH